jgi:acetolactate synthase-1/2/3 large subunit
MNGADRLCDTLLTHGVDVCFANPGTSEMHFVAALDRKPEMRCVLGLFEGVVTGAADGYARMADKPAVTLLHLGPGLANGLANLHNARRACTPMINVVGDHATYHLENDAPLTSNIESLAQPMSQWVRRIKGAGTVAADVVAAYEAAMTLPGVATLILPADAAWNPADVVPTEALRLPPRPAVDAALLAEVTKELRSGRRVALLLSGRALRANALAAADRVAQAMGARLWAQTSNGRIERGSGRIAVPKIPYVVDMAVAALSEIDTLVLVGAVEPVAFFAYPGKPCRLVREDCRVIALAGAGDDLEGALASLADEVRVGSESPRQRLKPDEGLPIGDLTDDAISYVVARFLPESAIVCDEAITSARQFLALSEEAAPHDYLQITGGAIGIGIPMAAGAAVACPDRKVISLQADGSGMYTVQGLWTQARENLDVVTVVFSNRAYAILQGEMRNVGVNEFGRNARRMLAIDEPALDWTAMARGMGVEAARADTAEEFTRLFRGALGRRGPFLIEAMVSNS